MVPTFLTKKNAKDMQLKLKNICFNSKIYPIHNYQMYFKTLVFFNEKIKEKQKYIAVCKFSINKQLIVTKDVYINILAKASLWLK